MSNSLWLATFFFIEAIIYVQKHSVYDQVIKKKYENKPYSTSLWLRCFFFSFSSRHDPLYLKKTTWSKNFESHSVLDNFSSQNYQARHIVTTIALGAVITKPTSNLTNAMLLRCYPTKFFISCLLSQKNIFVNTISLCWNSIHSNILPQHACLFSAVSHPLDVRITHTYKDILLQTNFYRCCSNLTKLVHG